jgi:hypothetical protein
VDAPPIPLESKEGDGEDTVDEPGIKVLTKKEKEKLKKERDKVYIIPQIITPLLTGIAL